MPLPTISKTIHVRFTSSETVWRRVNGVSVPEPPKRANGCPFVKLARAGVEEDDRP